MAKILNTGNSFSTGDQVTATKLNNSVDAATFASGAVDNISTGLNASGNIYVIDGGISTARLANSAVTTAKIADTNVTPAKLSTGGPSWTSSTLSVAGSLDFSAISTTATAGTYGRSGTTVTVSMTAHGMTTGMVATFTFNSGTGGAATGGTYVVTYVDANTFTITDSVSGIITGSPACSRTSYYGTSTIQGSQTVAGNLTVTNNITASSNVTVAGSLTVAGNTFNPLTRSTAQATTSGKYVDFTSIPSWVKRITIMFDDVSTNGADEFIVQIGDSGGLETSGYVSLASNRGTDSTSTAGFIVSVYASAPFNGSGIITICNVTGNRWVSCGNISIYNSIVDSSAGRKELSATLDRLRITTTGGANDFDAGQINIMYE